MFMGMKKNTGDSFSSEATFSLYHITTFCIFFLKRAPGTFKYI